MTTVVKGERWRASGCGCELTATGSAGQAGYPQCERKQCVVNPYSTHIAIAIGATRIEATVAPASEAPKAFPDFSAWLPKIVASPLVPKDEAWIVPGEFHYGWPPATTTRIYLGPDFGSVDAPPATATCGHPGPHGYGGLCFPCHARKDDADAFSMTCLAPPEPTDPAYRIRSPQQGGPATQSQCRGAGMGTWGLKEKNR